MQSLRCTDSIVSARQQKTRRLLKVEQLERPSCSSGHICSLAPSPFCCASKRVFLNVSLQMSPVAGSQKLVLMRSKKRWLEKIKEINFLKCPQLSCAVTSSHAKSVFAKLHLDGPACLSLFVIEEPGALIALNPRLCTGLV